MGKCVEEQLGDGRSKCTLSRDDGTEWQVTWYKDNILDRENGQPALVIYQTDANRKKYVEREDWYENGELTYSTEYSVSDGVHHISAISYFDGAFFHRDGDRPAREYFDVKGHTLHAEYYHHGVQIPAI